MADSLDVTALLHQATTGAPGAADRLLALVYADLRDIAERHLRRERPDHTLQATELVHEAYLRLVDQTRCEWQNRAHFLGVASTAMRRILVDHARTRLSEKRGGGAPRLALDEALCVGDDAGSETLLALDLALQRLSAEYPAIGHLVELRFFGGLLHEECAAVLGCSARTISRQWEFAKAWLYRELERDGRPA